MMKKGAKYREKEPVLVSQCLCVDHYLNQGENHDNINIFYTGGFLRQHPPHLWLKLNL